MDLPHVEVVGLEALEGFFELLHGDVFFAAVGADLGHDDGLVAFAFEGVPTTFFALAFVVLPGVIEEVDAVVEGLGDHVVDFVLAERRCRGGSRPCRGWRPGGRCCPWGVWGMEVGDAVAPYSPGKLGTMGLGSSLAAGLRGERG